MDIFGIVVLLGFLLFFGGMVYFAIQSSRKDVEKKQQISQALGFSPVEADPAVTDKIAELYRRPESHTNYEMRNVSRRVIPDGEMYLFDLVDTSGDNDSWTEHQAVGIVSPYLKMPPFTLFPKAEQKYALSGLANKVLEWGMSFVGSPVDFPEYPEFESRYILTSNESSDWIHEFFDQSLAGYFSRTQMFMLHASGDVFTFSEMGANFDTSDQNVMSQRVNHALNIFRLMRK
jgi:hypothetical protein